MATTSNAFVVIVAGGTGTRLWPLSRKGRPKQFLDLFEKGNFIQEVYQRAKIITSSEKIFIVAPESYGNFLDKYIPEFPKQNFMAEPLKKGTTAAYGYTAIYIKQLDPNATLHVLAADDYIEDSSRYSRMLQVAENLSKSRNCITIYGTTPSYPNTGYGYVQVNLTDKKTDGDIDYYSVKSFHEKPPLETAKEYLRQGDYFWHCFGFTVSVNKLLEIINHYDPKTYEVLLEIEKDLKLPARLEQFNLNSHYEKLLESDIENKVLEELKEPIYMVTMENTWSDIGTWKHVFEIKAKKGVSDDQGNVLMGNTNKIYSVESKNNLVFASEKPIALVGVSDMIIVETDDVTLICSRDHSQSVKKMVDLLKEKQPSLL